MQRSFIHSNSNAFDTFYRGEAKYDSRGFVIPGSFQAHTYTVEEALKSDIPDVRSWGQSYELVMSANGEAKYERKAIIRQRREEEERTRWRAEIARQEAIRKEEDAQKARRKQLRWEWHCDKMDKFLEMYDPGFLGELQRSE